MHINELVKKIARTKPAYDTSFCIFPFTHDFGCTVKKNILESPECVCLAGGAARSIICDDLINEPINDFDFFIKSKEEIQKIKNMCTVNGFVVIFECPEGELVSLVRSDQIAIPSYCRTEVIQLIYTSHTSSVDLIISFDFTVCMFAMRREVSILPNGTFNKDTAVFTPLAIHDSVNKVLRANVIDYPIATISRISKYVNRGYKLANDFPDSNPLLMCKRRILDEIREFNNESKNKLDLGGFLRSYID